MTRRIVISGGPGTGKTALIRHLEQARYPCFHEIIRDMTLEARAVEPSDIQLTNPLAFVRDPMAFNRRLLDSRLAQFRAAEDLQVPFVFYDRGLPDIIAYMDYFNQAYGADFEGPCLENRYDRVVLLPPWESIYRQDDGRLESFDEACAIHRCLEHSYLACGYDLLELAPGTLEQRMHRILELVPPPHG